MKNRLRINTSNEGKYQEFFQLFSAYKIELFRTSSDLKEIRSDPLTTIIHKASQLDSNTLVDDTSLEIEGASIGNEVRQHLDSISQYVGRKAEWIVLLAKHSHGIVDVYRGAVKGRIVHSRGSNGFGFDPYFLPCGTVHTLAESKILEYNARAIAVSGFAHQRIICSRPLIEQWEGPWQENS